MRRHSTLSMLVLAIALSSVGCASTYEGAYGSSPAYASAGVGVYFDNLSAYGEWIDTDAYGMAWVPMGVAAGWRPYTVGHWAYTDWGWMWVSADPWGWVPYHYGRWGYDASYGWVWVPGDVWAPAYVAWRYGDGWAGWAPLPPDVGWSGTVAFSYTSYDIDSRIEPTAWCFAPARALASSHLTPYIAPPGRSVTLLTRTREVTSYTVVNSHPVERGLRPEWIERDTGHRIQRYQVVDTPRPHGSSGAAFRGQTIQVTRPTDQTVQAAKKHFKAIASGDAPPPSQALYQRQQAEAQRFDQQMKQQRAALERQHAQELRHPPRGTSQEALRQRQDAEMKAQQRNEDRARQAFKQRQELVRRQMEQRQAQHDSQGKPQQGRSHGKGKGKDKGNGDRS